MLHYLSINLLALGEWLRELNGDERLIVALLRSMDSDNPAVRRRMLGQYKQFSTRYITEQLRLPASSAATMGRRILHLDALGIIERIPWIDKRTGHWARYVKLSRRYWKSERRAYEEAGRVVAEVESRAREYALKSEGLSRSILSDDHKRMIKEGRRSSRPFPPAPPSLIAAGGAGSRAAGGQESRKSVPPLCPHCNQAVLYLDWPSCHHCSHTWPGGVSGPEYFAGIPGAVP